MFHAMNLPSQLCLTFAIFITLVGIPSRSLATAIYIWDGQAGDGLWTSGTNWSANLPVAASDGAQFNNAYASGGQTISLGGVDQSLSQLTIANTTVRD